jgi:hypothetical protein
MLEELFVKHLVDAESIDLFFQFYGNTGEGVKRRKTIRKGIKKKRKTIKKKKTVKFSKKLFI